MNTSSQIDNKQIDALQLKIIDLHHQLSVKAIEFNEIKGETWKRYESDEQ